jgi:hypothetical protein
MNEAHKNGSPDNGTEEIVERHKMNFNFEFRQWPKLYRNIRVSDLLDWRVYMLQISEGFGVGSDLLDWHVLYFFQLAFYYSLAQILLHSSDNNNTVIYE